jgi:hypothetical protein
LGHDVPRNDELFVFDDGSTGIAVDWDKDVLHNIPQKKKVRFGASLRPPLRAHASLRKGAAGLTRGRTGI